MQELRRCVCNEGAIHHVRQTGNNSTWILATASIYFLIELNANKAVMLNRLKVGREVSNVHPLLEVTYA